MHMRISPGGNAYPDQPASGQRAQPRGNAIRRLERALIAVAVVMFAYCGWVVAEAALYEAYESRQLDEILQMRAADQPDAIEHDAGPSLMTTGLVLGRMEIPRLGVSTIIREGEDARTLRLAVGHIGGTALPGRPGNVGLAGHRDTFFRKLRDIQPDDAIRLVTTRGTFTYVVSQTSVVEP